MFSLKHEHYVVDKNELEKLFQLGRDKAEKERRIFEESNKDRKLIFTASDESVWSPFYKNFRGANGYYKFTRIGFSKTKKRAVLQVFGEGASWNSNETYILLKTKKGWKVYTASSGFSIA